jgi:hypothetical protein
MSQAQRSTQQTRDQDVRARSHDSAASRELLHFLLLPADQQREAIRRLAALGHGEHTISAATGLAPDAIRRVLMDAER